MISTLAGTGQPAVAVEGLAPASTALVAPEGQEAVGISLWDNKQNAEAYQRESYPEVQKILSRVIEGTPQVKTYDVPFTTLTKAARGGGFA